MATAVLTQELHAAESQIIRLNETQTQLAIYQHDIRHHLNAIDSLLSADNIKQAKDYIHKVQEDVETITPKRFCENELVNLLFLRKKNKAD